GRSRRPRRRKRRPPRGRVRPPQLPRLLMAEFWQQVGDGLATGAIYARLALAIVLIYRSTRVVNFAQSEMATFSTFVAWQLIEWGIPYWGAFFLTLGLSFVGGVAIERTLVRAVGG